MKKTSIIFATMAFLVLGGVTSCQKEEANAPLKFKASLESSDAKFFYRPEVGSCGTMTWDNLGGGCRVCILSPSLYASEGADAEISDYAGLYSPVNISASGTSCELEHAIWRELTIADGPFYAVASTDLYWYDPDDPSWVDNSNHIQLAPTSGGNIVVRMRINEPNCYGDNISYVPIQGSNGQYVYADLAMISQTVGNNPANLFFKHIEGVLKFNITYPQTYTGNLTGVYVLYNGTRNPRVRVGGTFDITFDSNGNPVATGVDSNDGHSFECYNTNDDGVEGGRPTTFCLGMLPFTYEDLIFYFNFEDGCYARKEMRSNSELLIERAKVTTVNVTITDDEITHY